MLSRSAWLGVWSVVLQWSRVGSNAVVFIILSRWLTLSEIGAVAAAQAPFILIQSLQLSVFPDIVIQERDADQRSLSTLGLLAIGSAVVLSLIALIGLVAINLASPGAVDLRYAAAFSLTPVLWGASSIPAGLLRQSLDVKALAARTSIASLLAGLVAISMGVAGLGGWALITFSLVNAGLSLVLTLRAAHWVPAMTFDLAYAVGINAKIWALVGRYGFSAMVVPLLQLVTAVQLGHAAAGALQVAFRVYSMVETLLIVPFKYLILPVLARTVREGGDIMPQLIRAISLGAVVFVPTYIGILAGAPLALPIVLGETNGAAAAPALQFLSLFGLSFVVTSVVNHALVANGEVATVFRRSAIMFFVVTIPCVVAVHRGLLTMLAIYALWGGVVGLTIAVLLARRYFSVKVGDILSVVWAPSAGAVAMWAAMALLIRTPFPTQMPWPILHLAAAAGVGIVVYPAVLWILNRNQLKTVVAMFLKRRSGAGAVTPELSSASR